MSLIQEKRFWETGKIDISDQNNNEARTSIWGIIELYIFGCLEISHFGMKTTLWALFQEIHAQKIDDSVFVIIKLFIQQLQLELVVVYVVRPGSRDSWQILIRQSTYPAIDVILLKTRLLSRWDRITNLPCVFKNQIFSSLTTLFRRVFYFLRSCISMKNSAWND